MGNSTLTAELARMSQVEKQELLEQLRVSLSGTCKATLSEPEPVFNMMER
jgi:hypothetical protein